MGHEEVAEPIEKPMQKRRMIDGKELGNGKDSPISSNFVLMQNKVVGQLEILVLENGILSNKLSTLTWVDLGDSLQKHNFCL